MCTNRTFVIELPARPFHCVVGAALVIAGLTGSFHCDSVLGPLWTALELATWRAQKTMTHIGCDRTPNYRCFVLPIRVALTQVYRFTYCFSLTITSLFPSWVHRHSGHVPMIRSERVAHTSVARTFELSDPQYWSSLYREEDRFYEWYVDFEAARPYIHAAQPPSALPDGDTDIRVLVLGVGNSRLSVDLIDDGYRDVTGIDFVPEAVTLADRLAVGRPIRNIVDDIRDLRHARAFAPFSLAVDKGTLDAVSMLRHQPGHGETSRTRREDVSQSLIDVSALQAALRSVHRVLAPGGALVSISAVIQPEDLLEAAAATGPWVVECPGAQLGPHGGDVHAFILRRHSAQLLY